MGEIEKIKWHTTGLDASVFFFVCFVLFFFVGVRGSGPPVFSLFRLYRFFLRSMLAMRQMTLVELHVKCEIRLNKLKKTTH